jgi:hypothetical protein
VTLVLDAGALIALDRSDRAMWVRLRAALDSGSVPVTHGGVVGQVWRGGPRQARLAAALAGIDIRPIDAPLGRTAGELLRATGTADVIDAAVALIAGDGDDVVTSDVDDLEPLLAATGRHVQILRA